jgi:tetratricopeptide (TPR) repeat protein
MGNPYHLPGLDDLSPWLGSGYAGQRAARVDRPVEQRDCRGCHMPSVEAPAGDRAANEAGRIASHRFAGAQTAMAASLAGLRGDAQGVSQLEADRELLRSAASLDLAALLPVDPEAGEGALPLPPAGASIRAGVRYRLDVVVRNVGAGHRFPGGIRDAQDTWLEVALFDAEGRLLLSAGGQHAEGEDPSAAPLRALAVDAEARPSLLHRVQRFRGTVADATIGPRDARVVRYLFSLPGEGPYRLRARLRHRRHERAFQEAACEEERSAEGAPFSQPVEGRAPPSACAPAPITELAEAEAWIGRGSLSRVGRAERAGSPLPGEAERLFALGLALGGQLQERLEEAEAPLLAGLRIAREVGDRGTQGLLLAQLSRVRGRQGRLEEALARAEEAEALIGPHPALDRLRGLAYALVWRWPEAASAFGRSAEGAPGDFRLWAALAQARGSLGRDRESLWAARRGLLLWPRDEALLRSQALALRALRHPVAEAAEQAYLSQRSPDLLTELRFRCAREVPGCARLQLPVRTIELRPPGDVSPDGEGGGVAADRRRSANSRL